jgi:hypothetical protein
VETGGGRQETNGARGAALGGDRLGGADAEGQHHVDLAAALAALEAAAREADSAALSGLIGELARVGAIAWARLVSLPSSEARRAEAVPRYVTQAEAAALFGIPLSTVRYLTRRGRVPSLGRGKNRRLLPADLARELEDCKRAGRPLRPSGRPARKPLDAHYADGIEGRRDRLGAATDPGSPQADAGGVRRPPRPHGEQPRPLGTR